MNADYDPEPAMTRYLLRVGHLASLMLLTAIVSSCDRNAELSAPVVAAPPVTANAEETALRLLVRTVAMALGDSKVRERMIADMRASPTRERKLYLGPYLGGPAGAPLLQAMSDASGKRPAALLDLLASLRPLEIYVPIREQRLSWRGQPDLIVAGQLAEDQTPFGFDLLGHPVALSLDQPPARPTMVLVPVEPVVGRPAKSGATLALSDCSDSAIIECPEDPPSGGGAPGPYPTGLFFNPMVVRDVHEPWTRGAPELEVHIFGTQVGLWEELSIPSCVPNAYTICAPGGYYTYRFNPLATQLVPFDCAGELATGYHWFNYDVAGYQTNIYDVYFAEPKKFGIVYTAKDKFGVVHDRRLVQLKAPYTIEVLERDDGQACPKPPRRVNYKIEFTFTLDPLDIDVDGQGLIDLLLFRNDNDLVSRWVVPTFDQLTAFNQTWLYGTTAVQGDADIKVGNNGLTRSLLPLEQVATVTTAPASATVRQGGTVALTATAQDRYAYVMADKTATWTSSNSAVAAVSSSGLVTGVGVGTATITATIDGVSGASAIAVLYPLMTAGVSGPTFIDGAGAPGTYTWTANPVGGSGAYAYAWELRPAGYTQWLAVGSARSYSQGVYSGSGSFDLRVTVTSTDGQTTQVGVYVEVQGAPPDTECPPPMIICEQPHAR